MCKTYESIKDRTVALELHFIWFNHVEWQRVVVVEGGRMSRVMFLWTRDVVRGEIMGSVKHSCRSGIHDKFCWA